jgi:hypothetical protein
VNSWFSQRQWCWISSGSIDLFPLIITAPLPHDHLSPAHEVCDIPDQAEHDHTLGGNKLGASFLARHSNDLFEYITKTGSLVLLL